MPITNIFDESPRVQSSKERRLKDAIQKKKWYPLYVKVEKKVLKKLAKDGQIYTYKHNDFWMPMDSLRDKIKLNEMCESQDAPWMVWDK